MAQMTVKMNGKIILVSSNGSTFDEIKACLETIKNTLYYLGREIDPEELYECLPFWIDAEVQEHEIDFDFDEE